MMVNRDYLTKLWKACREQFIADHGGLCAICLERGERTSGVAVVHRAPISEADRGNPDIVCNPDNLQILCRYHFALRTGQNVNARYLIDDLGRAIPYDKGG